MRRWLALGVSGFVLLVVAACGGSSGGNSAAAPSTAAQASSGAVEVTLGELNGSGETGTATLMPAGAGKTRVVAEIMNATSRSQPAHIHRGTCAQLDPTPLYGLVNVQNGRSETVVDVPLSKLTAGGLALNVHQSNDQLDRYVACGNLPGGTAGAVTSDRSGGY